MYIPVQSQQCKQDYINYVEISVDKIVDEKAN